jgi:hypothetical protein
MFETFSIGKDMEMKIQVTNVMGAIAQDASLPIASALDLGILERFVCNPIGDELKVVPVNRNGVPVYRNIQSGWEGEFDVVRTGFTGDLLHQILQEGFHGSNGAILTTVTQKIYHPAGEAYGSVEFEWPDAILRMTNAGEYRAEDKVVQSWAFKAGKRELATPPTGAFSGIDAAILTQLTALGIKNLVSAGK